MEARRQLWSLVLITLGACRGQEVAAPDCVTIAATTDAHGVVEPQTLSVGDVTLRRWGLVAASGYISILRQRFHQKLLLLDAGDLYQGTLVAKISRGEAIIAAYNIMGYQGVALGNHEFDYGPLAEGDADLQGILKARLRQAHFPFLAANMIDKKTGRRPNWPNLEPSMMVDLGGITVGVVGAITTGTPEVTRPQLVADFEFLDPVPVIAAEARELRANGARLVVLLAHFGGACAKVDDPNDASTCDAGSELFTLLARLPRGAIDVAIGGHTHARVAHWVHGTAVLQPLAQGRELGWAEVCVKPAGGIDRGASTIHPPIDLCLDEWAEGGCRRRASPSAVAPAKFLGEPVVPEPDLEAAVKPYLQAVVDVERRPLGVRLPRSLSRDADGVSLGSRICEAMVEATGARVAVQNLGGVRDDLPAGALTYGDVFQVLPFENRLMTLDMTGEEVRDFVQVLVAHHDGTPPYVAGLTVRAQPGGTEVELANGEPLEDDEVFKLVTNDYLGMGGEGADAVLAKVSAENRHVMDQTVLDAFIAYLQRRFAEKAKR